MNTEMNIELSVCGCDCTACEYFKKSECHGCSKVEGKVWWTKYTPAAVCPVYNCVVNERKYDNCGSCSELPCQIWRDTKDPSYTDKQHEESINERVEILKNLNKE